MYLHDLIARYGAWIYAVAFVWAFFEGETFVLFGGAAAAQGMLDPWLLGIVVAAFDMGRWSQLALETRLHYKSVDTALIGWHLSELAIKITNEAIEPISARVTATMEHMSKPNFAAF